MRLLSDDCCSYKYIRTNYVEEVNELRRLINKPLNRYTDPNNKNVHVKLFIQVSPDYRFSLGYTKGLFNKYQVIVHLWRLRNQMWIPCDYTTYHDNKWISSLKNSIESQLSIRNRLSRDIFKIYSSINPKQYELIYKPYNDDNDNEQIQRINNNLKRLRLSSNVLEGIESLSGYYPNFFCMDMWLEWLYFAMIAEYFPKKSTDYSKTGKLVKAIAIVQCLYSSMTPTCIAKFSNKRSNKFVRKYGARYLCRLADSYVKLWKFNLNHSKTILLYNNNLIYHPDYLNNELTIYDNNK